MKEDSGCICRGNWRLIVKEHENLLDRTYIEKRTGKQFSFFGLVRGSDDYYYGMWSRDSGLLLLTCVGSIEGAGFELVE